MCGGRQNKEKRKSRLWIWIVLAIISVIAVWLLSWLAIDRYISCLTDRGTFGDKFGAVNALFSGLAFAGLIATLLYQKEELKLQREELEQTREELKGQKEEFEIQNKTLRLQRFENTLFNMLSLQERVATNISYTHIANVIDPKINIVIKKKTEQLNGREVFKSLYDDKVVDYIRKEESYKIPMYTIRDIINKFGLQEYPKIKEIAHFDHYFRNLYQIIKYIDESHLIEDDERYDYICIVRSQLSTYELIHLFYNCISNEDYEKFKLLIEKYAILSNLRIDLLANRDDAERYAGGAYIYNDLKGCKRL